MGVVAATTLLWGTFVIGSDVLLPLWAAGDLGISADRWAHLRALRMVGVMVGILPLGVLAERYGARRLGPACMVLIAGVMVAWSFGEGAGLWVGMPLLGALVSASFVNLNTLTQRISDARQGLANSIYRGCFSATAIFAPILVTRLASVWSGYPPVLLVLAGILIASAAILFRYPGERPPGAAGGAWAACRRMWADYREAVRNRPLMRMIHVTQVWFACVAAVFTFAAIRFTQDLGVTDERFGEFSAAAGVMTMLGVLSTGLFLDKVSIRRFSTLCAVIAAACCLTMGLTDSVAVSAVAFILFGPMHMMIAGPVSMWVSRAAGESSQTSAFTVHKVVTAAYMAVGVASLGFLESWLGMRTVFLISGIVGVLTGAGFKFLSEPPPPRLREDDS